MEASILLVLLYAFAGGVFSLIGGFLLISKKETAQALATYATPFAAGALLAAVFLDLFKEGLEEGNANSVLVAALAGILIFFFMERFLHWFHHHHEHQHSSSTNVTDPRVGLIVVGDTLHNALDGVAIAAAFLISVPTGIVTTIAVAAHEIPQEIGDFGLLLSRGMSRAKVMIVNIVSAISTVVAAAIVYLLGDSDALPIGALLGLSAGFLLYIAMSDIIPTIHEDMERKKKLLDWRPLLLLLGVLTVALAITVAHHFEAHDHACDTHQDAEISSNEDCHTDI